MSAFEDLPELQYRILVEAAALTRPGGVLQYSTCTLNPAENEQVAERFLRENPAFSPRTLPLADCFAAVDKPMGHTLTLFPHMHHTDGFFLAAFVRSEDLLYKEWMVRLTPIDIKSLPAEELRERLAEKAIPAFRARQIQDWLDKGVSDFAQMSNLPQALREKLSQTFTIPCVKIEKKLVSSLDNTVKYLYGLPDGETVESVLMEYKHGWSQCLSTQVGCRMGCSFCATGMGGFVRNLLPSEMLAQIEQAQTDNGIRVSSVVLMGMGEPLDNYDNVLRFLKMLAEDGGVHIGMRHVSLSTCGLVDKIYQLMEEKLQLTLSISLHAPNDDIRSRLMPVNHRWPVEELLKACRAYIQATSRRISFEYAMIQGVNDSDACAHELAIA